MAPTHQDDGPKIKFGDGPWIPVESIKINYPKESQPFKIKLGKFCIDYVKHYGMNFRCGWSYMWHGSVIVDIDPSFVRMVWKALGYHWFKLTHGEDD